MKRHDGSVVRAYLLDKGFSEDAVRRLFNAGDGVPYYVSVGVDWVMTLLKDKKPEQRRALGWILIRLFDQSDTSDWRDRVEVLKIMGGDLPRQEVSILEQARIAAAKNLGDSGHLFYPSFTQGHADVKIETQNQRNKDIPDH
jgi:hypothetical protein